VAARFALVEGNSANVDPFSFKLRKVAKRRLVHRYGIGRYPTRQVRPLQRSQAVGLLDFPFVGMGYDLEIGEEVLGELNRLIEANERH
jgi:hypothetical protein